MAIDGSTIVVGARGSTATAAPLATQWRSPARPTSSARADGGATYDEVAKLKAADADWYDYFGWSVAIDGNTVVVGLGDDDSYTGDRQSAYVFRTTDGGATYGQVAKLTAGDAAARTSRG